MSLPVRNALFTPPRDLGGDEPCRLVGSALTAAAVAGTVIFGACLAFEWWLGGQTGMIGGVTPDIGLGTHIRYWAEGIANLTPTRPFAADVSAYSSMLDTISWWTVQGKAMLATVPALAAFYYTARSMWKPFSNTKHLAGIQYHAGDDALEKADIAVKALNKGAKPFIPVHPSITWLSEQVLSRGVAILGSAGAGKSAILAHLLHSAQEANHHIVVLDIKGTQSYVLTEINRRFKRSKRNVAIISPFCDTDAVIDIGRDMTRNEDATIFAASMIPEGGSDPMWAAGARAILRIIVLSLIHEYRAARKVAANGGPKATPWHWGHLATRVQAAMMDIHGWAVKADPMVAQMIADYEKSGTVKSFEIQMRTFASQSIIPLGKAWGDDLKGIKRRRISLREYVNGMDDPASHAPRQLVFRGNEEYEDFSQGYLRFALDFISKTALGLPDNPSDGTGRNLFLVLDEFISLGRWDSVLKTLEKGRSKGMKTVLAFQTQSALKKIYSEDDAKRILGNTYLKYIGLAADAVIANELASPYGTRKVRRTRPAPPAVSGQPASPPLIEEVEEVVLRPEILSSAAKMGPQKATKKVPAGVRAIVRIGDDLFHLQWPFASEDKVPRPPRTTYELAGWMTGDTDVALTDYVPFPKSKAFVADALPVVVAATGVADVGGIEAEEQEKEKEHEHALVIAPVEEPKRDHAELVTEQTGMATTVVSETVLVDAQRGSQAYTEATIEAVELQRAQEIRGEWQDQGEINEGAEMILEALSEHVLDTVLPGATVLMTGLKIAEGLEAPSRNVEHMLDSVGDVRTVTVVAPKVTVTRQKTVQTHDREQQRR